MMITIIEYARYLVKLLYFNSTVAIKILMRYDCFNKDSAFIRMPSTHSLYGLRLILIISAYFYMDMIYFGLVRVVSNWLRMGSVAVDSFGWVVADGFGWMRMVSCGFGWFPTVSDCFGWFAV